MDTGFGGRGQTGDKLLIPDDPGAVALSFARVAAGQGERPLRPEEIRNYKEPGVDTKFDVFEDS